MTTDIDSLKANQALDSDSRGSPNHGWLYRRIHPAFSRGVGSRYRDGAHRVHRQWRLDGGIRISGQGTPTESGGVEGVVRNAANWHVGEWSSGPCRGLHRRFVEAHADDQ